MPLLAAAPGDDPAALILDENLRTAAADRVLGSRATSATELAGRLGGLDAGPWVQLGPEQAVEAGDWRAVLRPGLHLALGDVTPDNAGGDTEPGLLTPKISAAGAVSWRHLEARISPELSLGLVNPTCSSCNLGDAGDLRLTTAWVGLQRPQARLGFGKEQRWLGPGRRGTLALSDNATAPWLGGGAIEGRLPKVGNKLGRFRFEFAMGVLEQPRDDVTDPGLMVIDARWLPVPILELGATRMTIFAGEGRPPVEIGQLILPTEPHIYDDPDRLLPDQNEIARLDFRLMLPIQKWFDGPVRYGEVWWEYAGEDVIKRYSGPVPYPALAGVANLYGAELALGPWVVTAEHARLLDDTFRWYRYHRVYHEGFTQNGRVLGHEAGTDSLSWYLAAAWTQPTSRISAWTEKVERIGVVAAQGDAVYAMAVEEHRLRTGLDLALRFPGAEGSALTRAGGLRPAVSGSIDRVTGQGHVPGADDLQWRVALSLTTDAPWGRPLAPTSEASPG